MMHGVEEGIEETIKNIEVYCLNIRGSLIVQVDRLGTGTGNFNSFS